MASKLFIENLPLDVTEERLRDIFTQIGEVESVQLKMDLITRRPKGAGFVEMSLDVDASRAMNCFDGATMKDRKIHVKECTPLFERARRVLTENIAGINKQAQNFLQAIERRTH